MYGSCMVLKDHWNYREVVSARFECLVQTATKSLKSVPEIAEEAKTRSLGITNKWKVALTTWTPLAGNELTDS